MMGRWIDMLDAARVIASLALRERRRELLRRGYLPVGGLESLPPDVRWVRWSGDAIVGLNDAREPFYARGMVDA